MTDLLARLRDEELGPSSVDLERALRDGRRTIRRRQVAGVLAAACAALTVVGGATTLVDLPTTGRGHPLPEAVADRPGWTETTDAGSAQPPERAPQAFDPSLRYAAFGWLPAGLTDWSVTTGRDGYTTSASGPASPGGKTEPASVVLRLVTAGHDIVLTQTDNFVTAPGVTTGWSEVTPAEPLLGRTARWNGRATTGPHSAALRWQYAPDAWAEVIVSNLGGGDARTVARRVAEQIRYGVDERLQLPYRLPSGLPEGLRPATLALTSSGSSGWSARAGYGASRTSSGDWPLTVIVIPRSSTHGDGPIAEPDTTIDGLPARRTPMSDGGTGLQVYGLHGRLYVELATHDAATTALFPAGVDGLFRATIFLPDVRSWQ